MCCANVAPRRWEFVNIWKLRQSKMFKTPLGGLAIQRAMALQQGQYRQAKQKLKEFERAFQAGEANLKVVFQVQEGPEGSQTVERWPEKLRRMARYFGVKPNELANRMIAAGILALETEDPDYEPDFVVEYRQKVVISKIEQYQSEKKLAAAKMTIFLMRLTPGACGESGLNSCSRLESISNAKLPSCEGLDDPPDQQENPPEVTRCLHGVPRNCRFWSVDFSSLHLPSKTDNCLNLKFGRAHDIQWQPARQQT